MNRKELRTLMEFVIDSNSQILYDTVVKSSIPLSEQELRTIMNVIESNTKDSFFRVMEKVKK